MIMSMNIHDVERVEITPPRTLQLTSNPDKEFVCQDIKFIGPNDFTFTISVMGEIVDKGTGQPIPVVHENG